MSYVTLTPCVTFPLSLSKEHKIMIHSREIKKRVRIEVGREVGIKR